MIAEAIAAGATVPYKIMTDRPEAVRYALSLLKPGDILAITGKGPEKFITIKGRHIPFNDAEAVNAWKAAL